MNIQIFGTKKSADTRKAERFFKERGIKFQAIDLAQKGFSKGELTSILQAVGGMDDLLDEKTKDREAYLLIKYLADEDKFDKVLEHPLVVKQPVVRNGRQATVGYQPEVWTQKSDPATKADLQVARDILDTLKAHTDECDHLEEIII